MLATQTRSARIPPPRVPPTRNATGFFDGEPERRRATFARQVKGEVAEMRWPSAREVAAQSAVAVGLLGFFALFGAACSTLARLLIGG